MSMKRASRVWKAASEFARSDQWTRPKVLGRSWVFNVSRVTTPNVPPPPPFSAQKRSGSWAALTTRITPSAVTTSASSRLAAAKP